MAKKKPKKKRKKGGTHTSPQPDLRALERRITQLEARRPQAAQRPAGQAETEEVAERSWALAGLRARFAAPGGIVLAGAVDLPDGAHADWQSATTTRALLDAPWEAKTERLAALAHPVRIELLRQVLLGARTTAALHELDVVGTTGQLYHHLRPLLTAGWLRQTARGRYEVPHDRVVPLLVVVAANGR